MTEAVSPILIENMDDNLLPATPFVPGMNTAVVAGQSQALACIAWLDSNGKVLAADGLRAALSAGEIQTAPPQSVTELLGYVSWALDNDAAVNGDHIVALMDAVKDAYRPRTAQAQQVTHD